jgi:hypothetical protein
LAEFEVADDEEFVEGGVLGEAAHALERDAGLVAAGGAERDHRARDAEEVVQGELGGERGLRAAAGEDRADLPGRAEVPARPPGDVDARWTVELLDTYLARATVARTEQIAA